MIRRLTSLAIAISSSLAISASVWAEDGQNGAFGDFYPSTIASPNTSSAANGENAADLLSPITIDLTQNYTATSNGMDGLSDFNGRIGGGIGGAGGGSVFGGLSQGGAGGSNLGSSANGGDGGSISNKTINRSNTTSISLTGTAAGQGGEAPPSTANIFSDLAGGAGGAGGGGSIFGGISQGGAGGNGSPIAGSTDLGNANGGNGGAISGIMIDLTNITLNGAIAGAAGSGPNAGSGYAISGQIRRSSYGAGGAGGAGGGSIFGGLSQGGAGGLAHEHEANGGHGDAISSISIDLTNVTLNGAMAGAAGNGSKSRGEDDYAAGAGGIGGAGGGSIFGGLSQGGAGGSADIASYSASSSSASGGNGGAISGIRINLLNITLNGGLAGSGGSAGAVDLGDFSANTASHSVGGGGTGGAGGASIFGGLSQGGAGGYASSIIRGGFNPNRAGASPSANIADASGGNGDAITGIQINLDNVTLNGSLAGAAGNGAVYGGAGTGGAGGGSVFGGLSQGGAGGYAIHGTEESFANGGNGGSVSGNTLVLTNVSLISAKGGGAGTGVSALTMSANTVASLALTVVRSLAATAKGVMPAL